MPGSVRFAYNKALHIKKHAFQPDGVNLSPRRGAEILVVCGEEIQQLCLALRI